MTTTIVPALAWQSAGTFEDILYDKAEGIAKLTINRPEVRNAFRPKTLLELSAAFNDAREDPSIGVIVLTGAGDLAFCSGGDQRVGSHLGPELVVRALRPFADGPEVRFVANVDPADLAAALKGLNPARTLVVVASKTFTTQETMLNAKAARAWLTASLGDKAVGGAFCGCIHQQGGRRSLWH